MERLENRVLLSGTPTDTTAELVDDGGGGLFNLVIEDTATGGKDDTLTLSRVNVGGTDFVRIHDPDNELTAGNGATQIDLNTIDVPVTSITGQLIVTGGSGDDALTVNFTGSNPIPSGGIIFDGGAGGFDSLALVGGSFNTVTHTFINASDGSIALDGSLITYTGLEPITDNLSAADRVFTFNGGSETIELVDDVATGFMTIDSTLGESVTFANPTSSLTMNAGTGDDAVTISSVDAGFDAALTINGGTGNDTVNLNADITFAAGNSLDVDLQNDAPTPGIDSINIGAGANLVLSGTGAASLTASRNIALASGSGLVTGDGDITLAANQQATSASGTFVGIDMQGSRIASESGSITLFGRGGDAGTANIGVQILAGAAVESTGVGAAAATIDIVGRGGDAADRGYGVFMRHAGTAVSSVDGAISVRGIGGAGSDVFNLGVFVFSGATIAASRAGNVMVSGQGGAGTTVSHGVSISGTDTGVSTVDGDLSLSGSGAGSSSIGVNIDGGSFAHVSGAGDVRLTATTGGSIAAAVGAAVETAAGAIELNADALVIGSAGRITAAAGTGTIQIRPASAGRSVELGREQSFNRIALSDAELDRISAGILKIGSPEAGSIFFATEPVSVNSTLKLVTGGSVDVFSDGGLSVSELAVSATGNVNLGSAMNVDTLAISSSGGSVVFSDADGFTVSEVGGQAGILAPGGIALAAGGGVVAVNSPLVAGDGSGIAINAVTIHVAAALATTGTAAIELVAERNMALTSGAEVVTEAGAISLSANAQSTPASGTFVGIDMQGSRIASESGSITLFGRGGDAGTANIGVQILAGAAVESTGVGAAAATIDIVGRGGDAADRGYGVFMRHAGTAVSSVDGAISVRGIGGAGSDVFNLGVFVFSGARVASTGAGNVTVTGEGGAGTTWNDGLRIVGAATGVSTIEGDITLSGSGAGSSAVGVTIDADAFIHATGSGNIDLSGTNQDPDQAAVALGESTVATTTGTGNISISADGMSIGSDTTIDAGANAVSLTPETNGTAIDLGGADAAGILGLTDGELDRITAGTINIGDANSGNIAISAAISPANTSSLGLTTGTAILDGNSSEPRLEVANLVLVAATGIGAVGNAVDIDVNYLDAQNSTSGNLWLSDANSITVNQLVLGGGDGWMALSASGTTIVSSADGIETVRNLGTGRTDLGGNGNLTLGEHAVRANGLLILTAVTHSLIVPTVAGAREIVAGDSVHVDAAMIGSELNPLEIEGAAALDINDPGPGNIFIAEFGSSTISSTRTTVRGLGYGTIDVDYFGSDVV
ncbi:MAG: LEPR-XLL domain-containing protein [Planctomycetes bacterium]|nr:LEPR-XLL domain-containing protein [Planctomycetota bacterium]